MWRGGGEDKEVRGRGRLRGGLRTSQEGRYIRWWESVRRLSDEWGRARHFQSHKEHQACAWPPT